MSNESYILQYGGLFLPANSKKETLDIICENCACAYSIPYKNGKYFCPQCQSWVKLTKGSKN